MYDNRFINLRDYNMALFERTLFCLPYSIEEYFGNTALSQEIEPQDSGKMGDPIISRDLSTRS
jgi:hypothetical protein